MNRESALKFLEKHQPMPSDGDLTQKIIDTYDEIRRYFYDNPDQLSIKLLLNSFGEGDGFGVYPLVEDTILKQDRSVVVAELISALSSPHRSVRYWCAQIASNFQDNAVAKSLYFLLSEDDFDLKYAALTSLEQSQAFISKDDLIQYVKHEKNLELQQLANDILLALNT